jgi:hypothetical protein
MLIKFRIMNAMFIAEQENPGKIRDKNIDQITNRKVQVWIVLTTIQNV